MKIYSSVLPEASFELRDSHGQIPGPFFVHFLFMPLHIPKDRHVNLLTTYAYEILLQFGVASPKIAVFVIVPPQSFSIDELPSQAEVAF